VNRDPLCWELYDCVSEIRRTPEKKNGQLAITMKALQETLHKKYPAITPIFLGQSKENMGELAWLVENEKRDSALRYTVNYILFASGSFETTQDQAILQGLFPSPNNPGNPPSVFFQIDLSKVTLWDLEILARDFKRILRKCLRGYLKPDASRLFSQPKELAFIRTVRADIFYRDLSRYDLHIKHGLTYRLIALLEAEGKTESLEKIPRQRLVKKPIPAESSVGDSVQRIFRAIHRKKYNSKRRRLDSPAVGIKPYNCPSHGDKCLDSCSFLKEWKSRVYATLQTDYTGS
jgi:hypothetical protein